MEKILARLMVEMAYFASFFFLFFFFLLGSMCRYARIYILNSIKNSPNTTKLDIRIVIQKLCIKGEFENTSVRKYFL